MWRLAGELGFSGGRVLEPGCGAGVFIGLAPAGAEMVGVELDDTTAAIAQELHPDARIIARSFADYRPRGAAFDLTVGNVPFADVRLHDPVHNRQQHSIHNHFIIKSLALTRPDGLAIVLTSRYTLDAGNPAARREISGMADLLGAIRLPSGAHRRAAGTDALTDLLVEHFPKILDLKFTAQMEDELDGIASAKEDFVKVLDDFYHPFQEALKLAAEHSSEIDLLVTDLVMPGMTGQQLAALLQQQHPGLGVIFMSGYSEHAATEAAQSGSSVRILTKPFNRGALLRAVREVLGVTRK